MRLLTYNHNGKDTYGVVSDDGKGVVDMGKRFMDKYADLKAAIAADALGELAAAAKGQPADASLDDITYLPVIPNPGKIFMVGLNYHAHREEASRDETANPSIFTRFPDSQVGHNQPFLMPRESDKLDWEGEMAVIIGKHGRRIAKGDALKHVAGYSCYNDGSVRDYQRHTTQWVPGKTFVGTGPFGPWMVTTDEIPDPQSLELTTRVNGEVMQHTTTDLMVFPIDVLINYCSTFSNLEPGDLIVSGTPSGVGTHRKPPIYLKVGDVVEIEISKIGILRNVVEKD